MTGTEPLTAGERRARAVGVGCLMTFLGLVSMGMVGVLISAIVAKLTKQSCPELASSSIPSCDWLYYWLVGGIIGAITLPTLVLRRMNQPAPGAGTQTPKS